MLNKWQITIGLDEKDNPLYQYILSKGYVYKEIKLCDDNKNRIIMENPLIYIGMPDTAVVRVKK